ncbi:MAG: hypothetical protein IJH53_05755 [Oscillospiraceae bacterium]|nr:hypothetical protein [Oscillospiraceae bacterium]
MYTYDICILAIGHDAEKAEILAGSLRKYRLPAGTVLPDPSLNYKRILLDTENALLDDAGRERLEACRWLALLCSPGTKDDPVILEKLNYFRQIHGKESVIPIIADAEPVDSFPEGFIEQKTVRRIMPDMSVIEKTETIEPVAADLRASTPARQKEVLRYETVRITASILGLHPDALEQRHRQRRKRALTIALSIAGVICLTAAAIFIRLGLIAKAEGDIAKEQTRLSTEIAMRTIKELPATFEGDEIALEYINEAVENAKADLAEYGLDELLVDEENGS